MEENMNMTEGTQTENMGNEAAQGIGEKNTGKLFTQDEVNSFVQSRISRMKAQVSKEAKAEYDQKLADLQAREMKLLTKEKLHEKGMPAELADIITGANEDEIDAKLDAIQKIYGGQTAAKKEEKPTGFVKVGTYGSDRPATGPDPVRKAMGLD